MELTRRDALRAMVVGGGAAGVSLFVSETVMDDQTTTDETEYTDDDIETLYNVAEIVYPSKVEVTTEFIETYIRRLGPERQAALSRTITQLHSVTEARYGRSFGQSSSVSHRESMLKSLGVHRVESTPNGTVPERVRYHVVNTLLYALFTNPKGSRLVGIESPIGHPGGFALYRDNDE